MLQVQLEEFWRPKVPQNLPLCCLLPTHKPNSLQAGSWLLHLIIESIMSTHNIQNQININQLIIQIYIYRNFLVRDPARKICTWSLIPTGDNQCKFFSELVITYEFFVRGFPHLIIFLYIYVRVGFRYRIMYFFMFNFNLHPCKINTNPIASQNSIWKNVWNLVHDNFDLYVYN